MLPKTDSNTPTRRVRRRAQRHRTLPHHYTFTLVDKPTLHAFSRRQRVPVHRLTSGPRTGKQHPNRLRRMERWVLSRYLLALEASGKITFPVRLAHALRNHSPDFMVVFEATPTQGYEVTQATTSPYQKKLTRLEQRGGPKYSHGGDGRGWIGSEPECYWCKLILEAVRKKLGKLAKGHYAIAELQHLLIYDDMDNAAVDLAEARKLLRPSLLTLLAAAKVRFDTISVVTTQSSLLYDVGGACEALPIPPPSAERRGTETAGAIERSRTSRSRRRLRTRRT
jgi:hypothetical protein